tara:strand:- start:2383 stop:4368 length:1986 start_codon:yes stop_codon:yes gene_type:complete
MGRSRDIAEFLSKTETNNPNNNPLVLEGTSLGLDSAQVASVGLKVFQTLDSLPTSNLISGQQALVDSDKRLYISNGLGWYNIAVINATPRFDSLPNDEYTIADSQTPLVITAKALDSDFPDNALINQSFGTDSAQYMVTVSNDSSVFTFTPKSADSIGIEVAAGNLTDSNGDFTYTFKWSDGINFVAKSANIIYNISSGGGGGYSPTSSGWWNRTSFSGYPTGGNKYPFPRGIVGASDGSIYVSGDEAAADAGMLVKYNADGNVQWAKHLNGSAYYARSGYSVSVSADANSIYTIGHDYGYGENMSGNSPQFGMAIKWTTAGAISWAKIIKPQSISSNNDYYDPEFGNEVDTSGNVWTVGTSKTGSPNYRSAYICKINGSTGALLGMWKLNSSSNDQQSKYNLALDEDDNVYTCTVQYVGSYPHMVISKFNSSMSLQWIKQYGATNNPSIGPYDIAYNIKLDSNKDIYLTGYTDTSSTPYEGILMKLSGTDGSFVWGKKHTDTSWHHGLAIDGADNIWIMGEDQDQSPQKYILRKYSTDGTLVDQWGIDNNVTNYQLGDNVDTLALTSNGNLLAGFYYYYSPNYSFAPMKLPASPTAGTYTNVVIADQTNSDATYSPSNLTSISFSVSDVTSSWETVNYNSGSYAIEPIVTLSTTEDLDTI